MDGDSVGSKISLHKAKLSESNSGFVDGGAQIPTVGRFFSDHESSVAATFARRTSRQEQLLGHMAHAAGGNLGERILRRLGIQVIGDTILRQLLRETRKGARGARVIGIDDWSWRKSQTCGTVVIDLECRTVLDVLEDCDVDSCTEWLKNHPEVEVISRDRCGLYAQAARQGAPQAAQVADRLDRQRPPLPNGRVEPARRHHHLLGFIFQLSASFGRSPFAPARPY